MLNLPMIVNATCLLTASVASSFGEFDLIDAWHNPPVLEEAIRGPVPVAMPEACRCTPAESLRTATQPAPGFSIESSSVRLDVLNGGVAGFCAWCLFVLASPWVFSGLFQVVMRRQSVWPEMFCATGWLLLVGAAAWFLWGFALPPVIFAVTSVPCLGLSLPWLGTVCELLDR